MIVLVRLALEYTPVILASALFGWRGLVWGSVSLMCARLLRALGGSGL